MHRIYQQVSSQLEKKSQPSYKEKKELEARTRELAELPAKIEALENEQNLLSHKTADSTFYQQDSETIAAVMARLKELDSELS